MPENHELDQLEEILGGGFEQQAQKIKQARASGGAVSEFKKSAEMTVELMRRNLASSDMNQLKLYLKGNEGPSVPRNVKAAELDGAVGARLAAYGRFRNLVGNGKPWDIKLQFPQWSLDPASNRSYFRDIWGNVHYGYLGLAAGFSELELFSGAGWNQKSIHGMSVLDAQNLNQFGKTGLGIYDDPKDTEAIRVGMRLWKQHGPNVSAEQLTVQSRASASSLNTK